jgi:hypothetical protein
MSRKPRALEIQPSKLSALRKNRRFRFSRTILLARLKSFRVWRTFKSKIKKGYTFSGFLYLRDRERHAQFKMLEGDSNS